MWPGLRLPRGLRCLTCRRRQSAWAPSRHWQHSSLQQPPTPQLCCRQQNRPCRLWRLPRRRPRPKSGLWHQQQNRQQQDQDLRHHRQGRGNALLPNLVMRAAPPRSGRRRQTQQTARRCNNRRRSGRGAPKQLQRRAKYSSSCNNRCRATSPRQRYHWHLCRRQCRRPAPP